MFQVHVVLPSGHHKCLSIPGSSKVRDLRIAAQQAFGQKLLRLATANHQILANPNESLEAAGLQDGECLTAVVLQPQLAATPRGFAFWCPGVDKILTWGYPTYGGDSSTVQAKLRSVQQIHATGGAFAAILADGSVVTWGLPQFGGDSSGVQAKLRCVQQIQATERAFAAILEDGSVVTWGDPECGGDSSAVEAQLKSAQQIQATKRAFAAILADGSIVSWGFFAGFFGDDISAVQAKLLSAQQIQAAQNAFAAILADGSVVSWAFQSLVVTAQESKLSLEG